MTLETRFVDRTNHRRLPAGYDGDVLVWDIDKTYLDTRFSSARGLLAIPFEFAVDKRALPGTIPLLRALRRGPTHESALVPLFFVSGSPPQLRGVVERKMTLDGVDFDGITFKDQLGLLASLRPKAIKEQVGYKLTALLLYLEEVGPAASWLCFGDDVEKDAESFLLFGEVVAGLRGDALDRRLAALGTGKPERRAVAALAERAPTTRDPVSRVFIHLERRSDPARFGDARVAATRSFLQTALVLAAMGKVSDDAVAAVAQDLRRRFVDEAKIQADLEDAAARLAVPASLLARAER